MSTEFPYSTRPEDVAGLLNRLPGIEVPAGKLDAGYIRKLGFTPASSKFLFQILRMLGFIDDKDSASPIWKEYAAKEHNKGLILASAIQKAYAGLFEEIFCPYLEDDQVILDFFKRRVRVSSRHLLLMLQTFRCLSELADFQDIMCAANPGEKSQPVPDGTNIPGVKINPALQLNIQIHIDPSTSDGKIEVIFKNMRKYLLEKGD